MSVTDYTVIYDQNVRQSMQAARQVSNAWNPYVFSPLIIQRILGA